MSLLNSVPTESVILSTQSPMVGSLKQTFNNDIKINTLKLIDRYL